MTRREWARFGENREARLPSRKPIECTTNAKQFITSSTKSISYTSLLTNVQS